MKKYLTLLVLVGGFAWFLNGFFKTPESEVVVVVDFCNTILSTAENKDQGKVIKVEIPNLSISAESKNKVVYREVRYSEDVWNRLVICKTSFCEKLKQQELSQKQIDSLQNALGDCILAFFPPENIVGEVEPEDVIDEPEPVEESDPPLEWNLMVSEFAKLKRLGNAHDKQIEFTLNIPIHYDWYYIDAFQYKNGVPYRYKFNGNNPGINYINEEHFNISDVGACPDLFLFGGVKGQKVDTLLFVKNWCKPFVINEKKYQVHNKFDRGFGFVNTDANSGSTRSGPLLLDKAKGTR